jgi:molybdopterin/thiamine biosynthesis adenylyltransferase/rhodanese-related sulfurtransferase
MTNRYLRQIAVPEIGSAGQARLEQSSVLVIGAGGLGSIVLQYLNAAGVGHIAIVDHDRVEESNLHRQPLYRMGDLGALKATAARDALLETNPQTRIDVVSEALTPANVTALVALADIVVDAADSFAVTYTLSDECLRAGKVLISASVLGLSGYVGAFCGTAPTYRAVFPEMPQRAGTCAQAGVLGTAVGVMGSLQAHITLSMLLELEPAVLGQLVSVDFKSLHFGGFRFMGAQEPDPATTLRFIAPSELSAKDTSVDLRTPAEIAAAPFSSTLCMTVDQVAKAELPPQHTARVVLCCRSGVRAWRAARILQTRGYQNVALVALG